MKIDRNVRSLLPKGKQANLTIYVKSYHLQNKVDYATDLTLARLVGFFTFFLQENFKPNFCLPLMKVSSNSLCLSGVKDDYEGNAELRLKL